MRGQKSVSIKIIPSGHAAADSTSSDLPLVSSLLACCAAMPPSSSEARSWPVGAALVPASATLARGGASNGLESTPCSPASVLSTGAPANDDDIGVAGGVGRASPHAAKNKAQYKAQRGNGFGPNTIMVRCEDTFGGEACSIQR